MAVTVHQQPAAYTPIGNPNIFEATSTQIANSDFLYRIIMTDLITSATQTYDTKQRPVLGELVHPAHLFGKRYIRNYVPNNVYGWQRCTDAIRKIRTNIGEYYSAAYVAGSNIDYIIWNAGLKAIDWPDYDMTDFVYKGSTNNFVYITSDTYPTLVSYYTSNRVTYEDRSHFLYCLSSETLDMEMVTIFTYDSSGNLLGEYNIINPYNVGTTYTDKYVCIDVGHKGLTEIYPLDYVVVSGPSTILSASVAYYDVVDRYTTGNPPPNEFAERQIITRLYVECEPTFTVYTLHFKAKHGNFETMHFNKLSEVKEKVEKSFYRINPNTLESNVYEYSKFSQWEKNLSSTGTDTLVLNSDWLTEDQVTVFNEIISSPEVYVDYGSVTGLVPVKVINSEKFDNKNYNNKLFGLNIEIEFTYRNNY